MMTYMFFLHYLYNVKAHKIMKMKGGNSKFGYRYVCLERLNDDICFLYKIKRLPITNHQLDSEENGVFGTVFLWREQ